MNHFESAAGKLRIALVAALLVAFSVPIQAQSDGKLRTGYVIVTPDGGAAGLVVFETFGMKQGNTTTQAGVLPGVMSTNLLMFVSTNGKLSRNLGAALANPGALDAHVALELRDDDGAVVGTHSVLLGAGEQIARYVTQMFAAQAQVPADLVGTLAITSDQPIAVIGLRYRGINFSTLPITSLSEPMPVPEISAGVGGTGAVILPHFAEGGGWATEVVISNTGEDPISVRVDLFAQDGSPLVAQLNGQSGSSFLGLVVPPGGVIVLSPRDKEGNSPF